MRDAAPKEQAEKQNLHLLPLPLPQQNLHLSQIVLCRAGASEYLRQRNIFRFVPSTSAWGYFTLRAAFFLPVPCALSS